MSSAEQGRPRLRVLAGCTAAGKTEWALRWAEARNAEIVSCDSLLFYRGMDIGTAKPSPAERAGVPHHLIDVCEVAEPMNVANYVARVRQALAEIGERGREPLIVGGSGFYLKAFFAPVTDAVEVTPAIRAEVAALSAEAALARLHSLNPAGLASLDTANPRRVARALERCLASSRTVAELAESFARQPRPLAEWNPTLTLIDRDPAELEQRIVARVAAMLHSGLVDEVRRLLSRGIKENPSAARAIGYREVIDCLEGRLPPEQLPAEIVKNTRALVKKQRTWFRTQLSTDRIVAAADLRDPAGLFAG